MIVWDSNDDPPLALKDVWCSQTLSERPNVFSIPRYVEDNGERLRAKYLAFIHDLGQVRIGGRRVVDHLDSGDGFSLWWMSHLAEKSPFKSPRIRDCIHLIALEELVVQQDTRELHLYSADEATVNAIRHLCECKKISFVWIPLHARERSLSLRRIYNGLPHFVRGVISLRHVVERWVKCRLRRPKWFAGDNAVFFCSYFIHLDPAACVKGEFYSRQWGELPKYLHSLGRCTNWIQHLLISPVVPDINTGIKWLDKFNRHARKQGAHSFLEMYYSWGVFCRVVRRWFFLCRTAYNLKNISNYFYPVDSDVWLWPYLRDDWMTSVYGTTAVSNSVFMELFDSALSDIPHQKIGFYLFENQGWERALLHAWKKNGHGTIIAVQHATVCFWHLLYFDDPRTLSPISPRSLPLPNYLAVNGRGAKESFIKSGYPKGKIIDVEALRYISIIKKKYHGRLYSYNQQVTGGMCERSILICGDISSEKTKIFLRAFETAVQSLPFGYCCTFKAHPSCPINLNEFPLLSADETADALDSFMHKHDVIVVANSTSAAVDGYVAGLHVVVWFDGTDLNLSPLRGYRDVSFVGSALELNVALQTEREIDVFDPARAEYYFSDMALPRWKSLVNCFGEPSAPLQRDVS